MIRHSDLSPGPACRRLRRLLCGLALCWGMLATPLLATEAVPVGDNLALDLLQQPGFLRVAHTPATPAQGRPIIAPDSEPADPLEPFNRYAYEFNGFLRRHLLEPATDAYLEATSRPVQKGIWNVFANLREPMTIASNLLLGDTQGANHATTRFLINTTAGLGGYYDRAAEDGYPRKQRTLEEVFCRYGVPAGPYVVLPILGPATARDGAGRVTTLFIQYIVLGPIYIPYRVSDIVVQYVELREQLRFVERGALDPYAAQRSAHMQIHRQNACDEQAMHSELFGQ